MAVEDEPTDIGYAGAGAGTQFAFPYYFRAPTDLVVTTFNAVTGAFATKVLNTDYTVSGTLDQKLNVYSAGATVTMTPDTTGLTVRISRKSPKQQVAVYQPNDPFPAGTHEEALDALALQHQELAHHYQGYTDGIPDIGTYVVDDWFFIRNAAAFGFKEIICTVAGSPGTWMPANPIGAPPT